jgi:hypothetical protein
MRYSLIAGATALMLAMSASCSSSHGAAAKPPRTYALTPQAARPDERALRLRPVSDGGTQFTLLGLTTGMTDLVGSHADIKPHGRYTRVRVEMVNNGRTSAVMDIMRQLLFTADGRSHPPDSEAMVIKRQPLNFDLGAAMRVQLDLWYDIPATARPSGMRLFGGATLTDMKDLEGTDIRLPS